MHNGNTIPSDCGSNTSACRVLRSLPSPAQRRLIAARMCDELEALIALAGDVPGEAAQAGADPGEAGAALAGAVLGEAALAAGAVDDELQDLLVVQAMAEPPPRQYRRRSWELLANARSAKALKVKDRRLSSMGSQVTALSSMASAVAAEFPVVAQLIGTRAQRLPMSEQRARICMKLAMLPAIRGANSFKKSQDRAVGLFASAALSAQAAFVRSLVDPPPIADDAVFDDAVVVQDKVLALDWQWDETTQRTKALTSDKAFAGERVGHTQVAVQVMVQHGSLRTFRVLGDKLELQTTDPIFCRPLMLEKQSADFLIEAVRKTIPIKLHEREDMVALVKGFKFIVSLFCVDRAAAN